jgi:hypothetical protein
MSASDIMSFYKEELQGDNVNMVSFYAAGHGLSKIEALWSVVDETSEAHRRATRVLSLNEDAAEAWLKFQGPYIGFHAGTPRYRLHEIGLC